GEARGWVALCPNGRGRGGYVAAGERDVLDAMRAVRSSLALDAKRMYLTRLGLGGTGTWLLVLRNPRLFAAACPVSGYGDLDQNDIFSLLEYQPPERAWFDAHNPVRLVGPGLRTAIRISHGEHDAVVSPVHARILDARLTELGIAHEFFLDPPGDHGPRFFDDDLAASTDFFAGHALDADGVADDTSSRTTGGPLLHLLPRGPFLLLYCPPPATAPPPAHP